MLRDAQPVSDSFQIESPDAPKSGRGQSWVAWMGAATIVIAAVILMWPGGQRTTPREVHLPFGTTERAYARKLQIEHLTLSAAENFLHQEITTLAGHITNSGDRPLANVELTIEFSDQLGQIVLRETRALFNSQSPPFAPGARRDFEISFEHIPPSANVQQPAIRVTGILFAPQ
ncbi:MAG TPA: FxLYD domain-containing protein [Candidatus Methylomirabilis sp.]|nr:FxLYD domain-containing protein [Candidatus Methylomirabilis sp.]